MEVNKPVVNTPGCNTDRREFQDGIEAYLAYLRSVRGMSDRTIHAYGKDLGHFAAYCENHGMSPQGASSHGVQGFIADLID
jgi:site-specific recombinase XerD